MRGVPFPAPSIPLHPPSQCPHLAGPRSSASLPAATPPPQLFSGRCWGAKAGVQRTPKCHSRPFGRLMHPPQCPHHPMVPGGLGEHPTVGFRMNFSPTPQNTSLHPKEPPLSPAHRTWSSQRVPSTAESHFSSAAAPGSHGMGFQRGGRPSPPGGLGVPRVRPVPLTRQAECPQLQVGKLDVGERGQLGRVSQHTGPTAPQQQRLQAPGGHRKPRVGPGRGNTLSPPGTPWDPPHILAAWL